MTIQNIFNESKQFISQNKYTLAKASGALLVVALLTVIPVGIAKNKVFESRITFNKNQSNPLALADAKTVILPGIAQADMAELNENPNPEIIKNYMCSIAPEYGVDWKLVYAIGYHESGNYHSSLAQRNNNYFGRKANSSGYASWATPEEGIRNQFEYIRDRYYSRGLTTPETINPVYAEDSSWQVAIKSVMNQL